VRITVESACEMRNEPALGFISMRFMRGDSELVATHARLMGCADSHDLLLKKLYVQSGGPPGTVLNMLDSLLASDGVPLVIPSLHHLWILGHPLQIREHLYHTGHNVLIAYKPAERMC
jgi:hypothetical protein